MYTPKWVWISVLCECVMWLLMCQKLVIITISKMWIQGFHLKFTLFKCSKCSHLAFIALYFMLAWSTDYRCVNRNSKNVYIFKCLHARRCMCVCVCSLQISLHQILLNYLFLCYCLDYVVRRMRIIIPSGKWIE